VKTAFVFGLLGIICVFYCVTIEPLLGKMLFGSLALCWMGVALAYAGLGAKAFDKQRNGRLQPWSALFWPYHLLNALTLRWWKQNAKENDFDFINEHVLLGCQLLARDQNELLKHNVRAVLDLTCEFSEAHFLRSLNYRSIPVLDTRAPTFEQLRQGAEFIERNAKDGAVYVHCALGHGRSALFVAAYLIQSGYAQNAEDAVQLVSQKREKIEVSRQQLALLQRFVARETGC